MSYADHVFVDQCLKIINEGISDEPFEVRPKWHDGTPAHTKKRLHVFHKYNLQEDPIPLLTLRRQAFKSCVDEMLWIYQKQTSKLSELNSGVWTDWDVGDGTIGKAYGYQIGKLNRHHKYQTTDYNELNSGFYGNFRVDPHDGWVYLSQIGAVLWDLKHDPGSRRIMTNTYNHAELTEMGLAPCAYSIQFNVTKGTSGTLYLNAILFQRSQDMLAANGWNVAQYAALVQMIAHVCGMTPDLFTHSIADCHIYDRHIPLVEELIGLYRDAKVKAAYDEDGPDYQVPFPNPGLEINPDVKSFFEFKPEDLKLTNYQYLDWNKKFEVAV